MGLEPILEEEFNQLDKEIRLRYVAVGAKFTTIVKNPTSYSEPCLRGVIRDELDELMDVEVYRFREEKGKYWVKIYCCGEILRADTIVVS